MAVVTTVLVPTRFITMVGHFIACVLVFWTKGDNVHAGLPLQYSTVQFDRAQASLTTALVLSMAFFVIELFGFWSGLTMFLHTHNFMHVIFHVAGCIATSIFIVEGSHYMLFWIYFAVFNALPGLVELVRIVSSALVRKQW
ncbi:transmembrane protein [Pavlovales sp. CCMP2436]|nr:transmembrane protein [Pavlovales sp. CCMP2436]|mmetsp:Transcript_1472/g.3695  ORF Transcript_1472/g.3695 Transcript_1472/m.3695 type:complete len:141 (-) Transcript_1472:311-733(-)|eukprot:CAMPEP_0179965602 /NCGR_PEP_ID=MMETSP0983-20121128/31999_1 /TAXON_ID=483367 /ORGANISM="non described non described, Strain CCMP 2436" /LENGTH=140 /DNA_ID=CAMNT_0021878505 /DNA_START=31 /DNA_END=453 /DNA_ORIENTATION=-